MPASDAMLTMWPLRRRHHLGQHQLAAGEHAVEVHLDGRADRLLGLLEERADGHDARVVDQHVDVAAAVGARLVEERRERLPVGDVERVAGDLAELGRASATADSCSATSRSPMTTRAPRASSAFAVAYPMPRAAPVIAMVLPRMLSMQPNFTRVKFGVEAAASGPSFRSL